MTLSGPFLMLKMEDIFKLEYTPRIFLSNVLNDKIKFINIFLRKKKEVLVNYQVIKKQTIQKNPK